MKKATIVLFAFLGVFLALIMGIFIGRQSISGMVVIPEVPVTSTHSVDSIVEDIEENRQTNSGERGKVNINTASVSLLQTLPNIGSVLAQRIVDYREENGNFSAPEDLLMVEGIGEARATAIRNGLKRIKEQVYLKKDL